MTGIRIFSDLRARMSPQSRARAEAKAAALAHEMDLAELRRAHALSQETIAETLHIGQAAVAKIEKRTDTYVSTLRRFVEAMGGELEINARFPDHAVRIRSFGELQVQPDGERELALTKGSRFEDASSAKVRKVQASMTGARKGKSLFGLTGAPIWPPSCSRKSRRLSPNVFSLQLAGCAIILAAAAGLLLWLAGP